MQEAAAAKKEASVARAEARALRQDNEMLEKQVPRSKRRCNKGLWDACLSRSSELIFCAEARCERLHAERLFTAPLSSLPTLHHDVHAGSVGE